MKKLFLVWFVFTIALSMRNLFSPLFSELNGAKRLREEISSSQFKFNSLNSSASLLSAMPMAEACHCSHELCSQSNPKPNEALS